MSYKQMTGNIISATKVEPDGNFKNSAASGVWSLQEAYDYTRGGNWPNVANEVPRGLVMGGGDDSLRSNVIDYITITTTGNATDFGDLSDNRRECDAFSSSTRAVVGGGSDESLGTCNIMEYVTIATTGNVTDFGNLTAVTKNSGAASSNTRGLFMGGSRGETTDYITISSTGNASDFGDFDVGNAAAALCCGAASPTRALVRGNGRAIHYFTIASTGNSTDFGDTAINDTLLGALASNTRALFAGGEGNSGSTGGEKIDFVTIASTGDATDFGDMTTNVNKAVSGTASRTRGIFNGAYESNVISYVTIATTGNATDFGDLTVARGLSGSTSNTHGGIA